MEFLDVVQFANRHRSIRRGCVPGRARGATGAPADLSGVRVSLNQWRGDYKSYSGNLASGNYLTSLPPINLKPDGTFAINGIGPASYTLGAILPSAMSQTWKLRTAIVDGRDLLDEIITGPAVHLAGVTLTLSDTRTELAGSLLSASGQPAAEYFVVFFSADRTHWRAGSRRIRSARPSTDGRFLFTDLPAGEYFLAALTDLDPAEWQTAAFLEQVAPAAIRVVVGEGEKKVQDLRIR